MELNKISKKSNSSPQYVENPEGSVVLSRKPEIQTYLEASALSVKKDSFYEAADEKLKNFIAHADKCDSGYLEGLANFLADNGIKLSPVVLLAMLANRRESFNGKDFSKIFNTPERIAEAISLENNKYLSLNNSFKKNVLKNSLEEMESYTLRKHKMKSRKIKLRDLIKMLHPVPKNKEFSELYKAIIEDSKLAKMSEKETFVRVKSSTKMSDEEKKAYYEKNLKNIPLNEFIRNLRYISDNFDFKKNYELLNQVIERLKSIDEKSYRYFNVFDLIETAVHVPALEKALFEVIKDFVEKVKVKFDYDEKNATILFDISGSMGGEGSEKGFRYLTLFALLFGNSNLRLFNESLLANRYNSILEDIRKGNISSAAGAIQKSISGGTALLNAVRELDRSNEINKNLIIISDEVSWVEGEDLRGEIEDIGDIIKDKKIILVNPVVYSGTVIKKNVLAIASLTSTMLYNLMLSIDPDKFITLIRSYKGEINENKTKTNKKREIHKVRAGGKSIKRGRKSKGRSSGTGKVKKVHRVKRI